jgi:hypothetical protein
MNLARVAAARAAANPRPSWCAVFTKAYGLVVAARPELRRDYLSFPWPHLYEHREGVSTVSVERPYGEETAVFFVPMQSPDCLSLARIDARLRHCKESPAGGVGSFRRQQLLGRIPGPLRRCLWWLLLNCLPRKRAKFLGTFGVTVYAGLGASSLHPLSVLSTTLNYGVMDADGSLDVRLVYDHRVLDGATVARALADLENVLNGPIADELLAPAKAGAEGEKPYSEGELAMLARDGQRR